MDRRRFLAAVPLAATSGCLGQVDGAIENLGEQRHPLAGRRLRVGLDRRTDRGPSAESVVPEALSFWEDRSEEYAGFPVSFRYDPDAGGGLDLSIVAVEALSGCGDTDHDHEVAGCAPLLRPGAEVELPVEVRVVFDDTLDSVIRTTKHELGHVLGLGHGDEPRALMASDPSEYVPEFERKRDALETYTSGFEAYRTALSTYEKGVTAFDQGSYEQSLERLSGASSEAGDARGNFERVDRTTREIDLEEATSVCTRALSHLDVFDVAIARLQDAVLAFQDAKPTEADGYLEDHREAVDWLNAHDLPPPQELYDVLEFEAKGVQE